MGGLLWEEFVQTSTPLDYGFYFLICGALGDVVCKQVFAMLELRSGSRAKKTPLNSTRNITPLSFACVTLSAVRLPHSCTSGTEMADIIGPVLGLLIGAWKTMLADVAGWRR